MDVATLRRTILTVLSEAEPHSLTAFSLSLQVQSRTGQRVSDATLGRELDTCRTRGWVKSDSDPMDEGVEKFFITSAGKRALAQ